MERSRTGSAQPALGILWMLLLTWVVLGGCDQKSSPPEKAKTLTRAAVSVEDGMILLDYPGPKAQVVKRDGLTEYFCDTGGMLNALLDPERAPTITAAFVQPFDGREWGSYPDGWVLASQPVYVLGSKRMGAMGPTLVPFLERAQAEQFAREYGGQILAFSEINNATMALHARLAREHLRDGGGHSNMAKPNPAGKPISGGSMGSGHTDSRANMGGKTPMPPNHAR